MKKVKFFILTLAVIAAAALAPAEETDSLDVPGPVLSQKELIQRYGFIDEDCDGLNDLARDADNDGIPNCLDPDWVRPEDGSGYQNRFGYRHQNANVQNRGSANQFRFSYNYLWNNNWGPVNDTNLCNNTVRNGNQGRNRKTRRGH